MTKILFVQPLLASYRIPIINGLSAIDNLEVCVLSGKTVVDFGDEIPKKAQVFFRDIKTLFGFKLFTDFYKLLDRSNIDIVLHFADFKYVSLWFFLIARGKKRIFLHGQGGYKKSGFVHNLVYNFVVFLCDGYICYNDYAANSLKSIVHEKLHHKISVVENTLYLPVFEQRPLIVSTDLFYIGRLREGCGIEFLLDAAKLAGVKVRVIGGCEQSYLGKLQQNYPHCTFYGSIFDTEQQYNIASDCMAGAYGGDAGLSVVHYMAFGLPVIVHNDIAKHMGPEPSYVEHGKNGLTFQRGDLEDLASKINELKQSHELQAVLSGGAIETFKRLQSPPMHEKFAKILGIL
jgi:glycosyltransferase involved in cell wall biosynthesis